MQGLQIWVNLPQKNKKVKPWYQHIKRDDIPVIKESSSVEIKVLVGKVKEKKSFVQTYSPVSIFDDLEDIVYKIQRLSENVKAVENKLMVRQSGLKNN